MISNEIPELHTNMRDERPAAIELTTFPGMIRPAEVSRWRTVAADVDGIPRPERAGELHEQMQALFAYRADADRWLTALQAKGYEGTVAMAAVSYFGPTDSPSNCWSVSAEILVS